MKSPFSTYFPQWLIVRVLYLWIFKTFRLMNFSIVNGIFREKITEIHKFICWNGAGSDYPKSPKSRPGGYKDATKKVPQKVSRVNIFVFCFGLLVAGSPNLGILWSKFSPVNQVISPFKATRRPVVIDSKVFWALGKQANFWQDISNRENVGKNNKKDLKLHFPSLPNTLLVGVWTPNLLRRLLRAPNTYSPGIWRILED